MEVVKFFDQTKLFMQQLVEENSQLHQELDKLRKEKQEQDQVLSAFFDDVHKLMGK